MDDQSMLWGWPLATLEKIGVSLLIASVVFGVLALLSSWASSSILYKVGNTTQAALQAKALGLEHKTEELRQANLLLEAQIAPRRLNAEQLTEIVSALDDYAGKRVGLESYALDIESAVLGKQLILALKNAGLTVDAAKIMSAMIFGSVSFGVHVSGEDKALVSTLATALEAAGLRTFANSQGTRGRAAITAVPDRPAEPTDATIFIGVKPLSEK